MKRPDRRTFLAATGLTAVSGTAGCLNLSESQDDTSESLEFPVVVFLLRNLQREASYFENGDSTDVWLKDDSSDTRLDGAWSGDTNLMRRQSCARYSIEILEDGTPIADTGERFLVYGYKYAMGQTESTVFITRQPSVKSSWKKQLLLSHADGEVSISPTTVKPNIFEFDLNEIEATSGRYEWIFEISPPHSPAIRIGAFHDKFIDLDPSDGSEYYSRDELSTLVGQHARGSAVSVKEISSTEKNGLQIDSGVTDSNSTRTSELMTRDCSQDIIITCDNPINFGPSTDRTLRINNLTTSSDLEFKPQLTVE